MKPYLNFLEKAFYASEKAFYIFVCLVMLPLLVLHLLGVDLSKKPSWETTSIVVNGAKVTKVISLRTSPSIVYTFYVNGKNVGQHIGGKGYSKQHWEGRYFPIIYDTLDPFNNHILTSEKDFKAFGLDFPDSLKWSK